MENDPSQARQNLKWSLISRFVIAIVTLGLIFFLPAGTLYYWEAWVYIMVLALPVVVVGIYVFRNNQALLERRMRTRETQGTQKLVIALSFLFYIPFFIIPGLDRRFGWSNVPVAAIIISDALIRSGYLLFAFVLKTNSYASRIIEVEKGQKVITTGPYTLVRHPMYLAVLIIYMFSPMALGSYWALIPAVLQCLTLPIRIIGEEKELTKNLEGYKEYIAKTKYRLIPGVW